MKKYGQRRPITESCLINDLGTIDFLSDFDAESQKSEPQADDHGKVLSEGGIMDLLGFIEQDLDHGHGISLDKDTHMIDLSPKKEHLEAPILEPIHMSTADDTGIDVGEIMEPLRVSIATPPRVSPGRRPPTRLMRQEDKPKLASPISPCYFEFESLPDLDDDDHACAVGEAAKADKSKDDAELIPGLLGTGRWRRLKGGVTMDSGCSLDIMPVGAAPGIKMQKTPEARKNKVISAANGTRIKEHGVKRLRFRTRDGKRQAWSMVAGDVKKALKSIAVTCDGVETGECHVLFTKHGGRIINLGGTKDKYTVDRNGVTFGTDDVTKFDRTRNTYGMEAWVYVGDQVPAVPFSRPVVTP